MKESLRVLIADDQGSMRSMLKKMMHQMGPFQVIDEAGDGEEAWEKLQTQSFDLVVCDVKMPHLDGIGLLKRCRKEGIFRDIPFLMISGESVQDYVAIAGEWGAYDYLIKPFSFAIFKARVESTLERFCDPEESLYRGIEKMKEEGDARGALERIEKLEKVTASPKLKWMNLKGECLMELGQMEGALVAFEKALELSDRYLPAYKNSATVYQKLGNAQKAVEALEKADQLSPKEIPRKITLAKLLLQTGREEDGSRVLAKAIQQCPDEEKQTIRLKVAEVYLEAGWFAEAEKLYVRALQSGPGKVETYNRLGIALRRQGKFEEAKRYYRLAIENHPDVPAIYYNLGVLHMNQSDKTQAAQLFKKALELDPGFTQAQEMLQNMPGGPGETLGPV